MYRLMLAKATLGFMGPSAGWNMYSSSKAQTNRSFVCSQLESTPAGKGPVRFRPPLPVSAAFPFPFIPFPDRRGPGERIIGVGGLVSGGISKACRDRG